MLPGSYIFGPKDFITTGNVALPLQRPDAGGVMFSPPFMLIPQKWALQVTGLTALNVVAVPTSWTVNLVASLDGIAFNATSLIVAHVGGVNANGDVVWNLTSSKTFYLARYAQVQVAALTLGATATKIRVSVVGDR